MGEQHADLARLRQPHESAVVLQDQVVVDVIGRELDVPAAGQWAPLAADLRPRHVGQNGLPVGGGEELDDVCWRELLLDALPQPGRHAGPDEQPDRVVAVGAKGRIALEFQQDIPQHCPRVGHDGDAILA